MSWPGGTPTIYFQTSNGDEIEALPNPEQESTQIREENVGSEPISNHENETVNADVEKLPSTKRRKLNSKVWKEFTKYKEDGIEWAICKHCERKFNGSSKKGTTHLKNHLERCHRRNRNPGEGASVETNDLIAPTVVKEKSVIDEELNNLDAARIIIKYGFSSLKFIKADILHVYKEEKEKLRGYLNKLSCHFHLKFELYDMEYILVVLHFIDDNWVLKNRIIDFASERNERDFSDIVKGLLLDLNVDKNICSIVTGISREDLDLFFTNSWISKRALLPFNENVLTIHWLVDNLKRTVKNGPSWMAELLSEIKMSFSYIRESPSNENRFRIALNKAKSMGKKVSSQGLPNKWIFDELEVLGSALGYKEAFCELETIDHNFRVINLTDEGWYKTTVAYECARVLKDAADNLSRSKYTTANVYFPKVCDIYMKLLQWEESDNSYVREIASSIREKYFDRYWSQCNLALVIAVVLDPRFKMEMVVGWYKELYGEDANTRLRKIYNEVNNVYNEYAKVPRMLDTLGRPCGSSNSELDLYLMDLKIPSVEEFDILAWWRTNSQKYPTLARMARDYLAMPISTSGFTLDSCHLSSELYNIFNCDGLDTDLKKALVCTKSWLKSPQHD
ncbi:zinc finger BED domain-containing protein RICESLEEPER 1-like [Mangifera indica]|uniref:zinc finger BED domain-containing protein RICESLEEPER 1-like n=1 Tax=Mangifera indica TaxID=29780 RepID=UPI001CFA0D44|nr:zinc finger BED domain-containing protein RICESLEEPER 1-like [Mangifera indica]